MDGWAVCSLVMETFKLKATKKFTFPTLTRINLSNFRHIFLITAEKILYPTYKFDINGH